MLGDRSAPEIAVVGRDRHPARRQLGAQPATPGIDVLAQNKPVMRPWVSMPMALAAGMRGRPGMVMMSPHSATTKPAPADRRTSRTGRLNPEGAPFRSGSAEKLYWVLAMQTGRC